jgi:hypothetical protein
LLGLGAFERLSCRGTRQYSDLALALVAGVLSTLLLDTDARLRGKPFPTEARWLLLPVWPVALTIYTLATRKVRGLWVIAKHLALGYALFLSCGFAARFIVFRLKPGFPLPP